MKLVNIGCGAVFHPEWLNFDVQPVAAGVVRLDARKPFPFLAGEVDAVYHSHVLEHLDREEAAGFLRECLRVLKPGGVIRVVVPDLEGIARAYLDALAAAKNGGDDLLHRWTQLELTDQLTREVSGGEMARFLRTLDPGQTELVKTRAGVEAEGFGAEGPGLKRRRKVTAGKLVRYAHLRLVRAMVRIVGGRLLAQALTTGVFRQRGEVHRVMYDAHSLARLLRNVGFDAATTVGAGESRIAGFGRYELDMRDGRVRKPDSLFMEAVKP